MSLFPIPQDLLSLLVLEVWGKAAWVEVGEDVA